MSGLYGPMRIKGRAATPVALNLMGPLEVGRVMVRVDSGLMVKGATRAG